MNTKLLSFLLILPLSAATMGTANAQVLAGIPDAWLRAILDRPEKTTHVVFKPSLKNRQLLAVTATAYTSHVGQTDSTPNIAAWGDRLRPGMKAIAVSRDLLDVYGLKRGSKVRIHGLPGYYVVLDKMNKRWRRKIDIYMGKDKRKAFQWGRRKVTIEWAG